MTEAFDPGAQKNRPALSQAFQKALASHDEGDLVAADRQYRDILATEPNHCRALDRLGMLRLQMGDAAAAIPLIKRSLDLDPSVAESQANLGTAYYLLCRYQDAIISYEKALLIDPDNAEAHYGLGIVFHALRRTEEAIASFERALAIDPDYPETCCALAAAQHSAGRLSEAITNYMAALAIDPDYADAECGLADALRTKKRLDDAITHYRRAIALNPAKTEAHIGLGIALHAKDQHKDALLCFDNAQAIQPNCADSYLNRGIVLQVIGAVADAQQAFREACAIDPRRPDQFLALANCGTMLANDPALDAMKRLAHEKHLLTPDAQIRVHFALGKALADLGDNRGSFDHFRLGNTLRRQCAAYDERSALGFFDRIRTVFSPEFLQAKSNLGNPTTLPVFIVGMPRSGTTLVEQILSCHPLVHAGGEREDLRAAIVAIGADSAHSWFPESANQLSNQQWAALGQSYLARIEENIAAGARTTVPQRFIDKTLMHFCLLGLIQVALPNARIIHVQRDPVDTCLSCYSQLFEDDLPFTYDLGELGRYYSAYANLMAYWRRLLPAEAMLELRYENLVGDFERQARRMIAYCGIPWDEACLSFHKSDRAVRTASVAQVRQPIYRHAIGRWRPDPATLRPLLQGLGHLAVE